MAGLINSGILTNPKIRSFGNSLIDQGMRFQSAPTPRATPQKGGVASTSQALTASPAAQPADWDAWSKADWSAPVAPHDSVMSPAQAPLKGTAPAPVVAGAEQPNPFQPVQPAPSATPPNGAVAATSQALTAEPASANATPIDWDAWASAKWGSAQPGGAPIATVPRSKAQQYADQAWGDDVVEKRLGRPLTADEQKQAHDMRLKWEAQYLAKHPEDRDENLQAHAADLAAKSMVPAMRPSLAPRPNPFLGEGTDSGAGGSYAPEPAPEPPPAAAPVDTTPGVLETPGIGETTTDKTLNDLDNADADQRATIDQIMKHGGLAPQDFDQFYKNAWEHSARDLNSEYAGRGMGNSSDAMRALGHSRSDLAAQQSKDEADYAMKSWTNDMSRLATVAGLQGKITDQDLERWGLKQQWSHDAQRLEEGRLGGYLTATETAFNSLYPKVMASFSDMTEADQKQVAEIIGSLPAMFQDTANQDSGAQEKALASLAEILKLYSGGKGATAPAAGASTGASTG